jgi:hypothetical protein
MPAAAVVACEQSDGYVPAWLAYLFDKVDYLERELMRAQVGPWHF